MLSLILIMATSAVLIIIGIDLPSHMYTDGSLTSRLQMNLLKYLIITIGSILPLITLIVILTTGRRQK